MKSILQQIVRQSPLLLLLVVVGSCSSGAEPVIDGALAVGTYGGDDAGLIVSDTIAHIHVGCTFGYFKTPIRVNLSGAFSASGSYVPRAYPIQIGPEVPANLVATTDGNEVTLTVFVNDTVENKNVTFGPVKVTFKKEPKMGPCPICRNAARKSSAYRTS